MADHLEEIKVLQAGEGLHTLAWNEQVESRRSVMASGTGEKINRYSWGHSYLTVRGEILEFVKVVLLRRHLPKMFPLIKIES